VDKCRKSPDSRAALKAEGKPALVSVCLLTYNHVHVVEETITSVLAQHCRPFEFIVSDDCSHDGTWEEILELAERFPQIRPLRTARNLGMPGNANFAVSHCLGEYVALLHHDDLYHANLLARWTEVLEQYPSVAFVFNDYRYASRAVRGLKLPDNPIDGDWFLREQLLRGWGSPVRGTAMIRRHKWDEAGGLREEFGLLADVDLWMRLASVGDVGYVSEPLITVRHSRPRDYPVEYGESGWSWTRHRLLLEIHASNQSRRCASRGCRFNLAWYLFLVRLNSEQLKWLCYGVVRQHWVMAKESGLGETTWDSWVVRLCRAATIRTAKWMGNE
jgi:glycosyltransferase involved in cell wall biosynthesis